jgi:hypothetical protein
VKDLYTELSSSPKDISLKKDMNIQLDLAFPKHKNSFQNIATEIAKASAIIFFVSHICCSTSFGSEKSVGSLGYHQLVSDCRVYSFDGSLVRQFPGGHCLFMDNGNLISASPDRITMMTSDKTEMWKILGNYHHQINWTQDKQFILAITTEKIEINGVLTRVDGLQKIDLKGKVVAEIKSNKIHEQLKVTNQPHDPAWDSKGGGVAKRELSHFNSFYEIQTSKAAGPIKSGNFVVNSKNDGVYILNSSLNLALKRILVPTSEDHRVHDVTVTSQGKLLFLNNLQKGSGLKNRPYSTIEQLDPNTMKVTRVFSSSPPEAFYSSVAGGVQELNSDTILISQVSGNYLAYNTKTKRTVFSGAFYQLNSAKFWSRVRAEDLTKFLSKW